MFDFWVSRVVSEVHCCATKKNKEWQEKLPIVVLKAEEILYSKADSKVPFFFSFGFLILYQNFYYVLLYGHFVNLSENY